MERLLKATMANAFVAALIFAPTTNTCADAIDDQRQAIIESVERDLDRYHDAEQREADRKQRWLEMQQQRQQQNTICIEGRGVINCF